MSCGIMYCVFFTQTLRAHLPNMELASLNLDACVISPPFISAFRVVLPSCVLRSSARVRDPTRDLAAVLQALSQSLIGGHLKL